MAVEIRQRRTRDGVLLTNIALVRTDDFRQSFEYFDNEGRPVDITNAEIVCHIRTEPGLTGTPLLTIDNQGATGNGSRITISPGESGGENGDFEIHLDDEDVADLYDSQTPPPEKTVTLYYDVVLTLEESDAAVVLQGKLLIEPGVTRF